MSHQISSVWRWFKGDNPVGNAVGFHKNPPPGISLPSTPTTDTAANAILQQQDALNRRKGVLGTIFGGAGAQSAPSVATKSLLGQ